MGAGAILAFLMAFTVSAGLPLLKTGGDTMTVLPVNGSTMAILFVLGIVASATMVIPGVSGSMMLMVLGYYYGIINTITSLLRRTPGHGPGGLKGRLPAVSSLWHRRSRGSFSLPG